MNNCVTVWLCVCYIYRFRSICVMTEMSVKNCCCALSVSLNLLLLTVLRPALIASRNSQYLSTATMTSASQSVIRSNREAQYVMYGRGNLADDNEHLLNYIRSMTSRQGPGGRRLASERSVVDVSQMGGSRFVDNLLKQRRNGFFVECGAFDGEEYSDTFFFEMQRNWTGILIEPHPYYHRSILSKNRNALVLRACLSHSPRPVFARFRLHRWGSGVSVLNRNVRQDDRSVSETDVQCFTVNSIMAAIGVRHIDFMVLDVEGSELPVLRTIDWTRLSVDVFSIEYRDTDPLSKLDKIRHFFNQTGISYKEVGTLPLDAPKETAQDVIFMRVYIENELITT